MNHNDTANNHVRVPKGARVKFPSTSRKAIGNQAPAAFVLWEKPHGTDRLDDLSRDYPEELREAMARVGGFTPEVIEEQVKKVSKTGDSAIPLQPRAPVSDGVDL